MRQEENRRIYVFKLTLVATLGGLLFGYDTAVVSGAIKAIREFFVIPLTLDSNQAEKVIYEYRIAVGLAVLVVVSAVCSMLFKLYSRRKSISLSGVLFVIAGLLLLWQFHKSPNLSENSVNAITGFAVSSALFGCIIGGSFAGFISSGLGRKNGLILSALLFLISALGSAFPEKMIFVGVHPLISFIFYRIIGGVGIGLASMLSPMYIAEIAPAGIRGKLVSWNQFAIIFGMLVVYFVNWFISRQGDEQWNVLIGWRWMFLSGAIPAFLFMTLLFFIPETPRFLVLNNKQTKAKEILTKLVGPVEAEANMKAIIETMVSKSAPWLSFGSLVIFVSIMLASFQQLMGINVILYYAPKIFQNMGTKLDISLLQTSLVGVVNLIFTLLAIYSVDKIGRKPLLVAGGLIMALAMSMVGFTFFREDLGIKALVFILLYIAGFALSWGPVMWVVLSEIFPNSIRGAMSMATATVWISNMIISWSFPVLDDNPWLVEKFHHGFVYWIYAIICLVAVFFVIKMVPETKGKSLEQIEKQWLKNSNNDR